MSSAVTLALAGSDRRSIDFCMCNPPFYASSDELLALAKAKQRPPFSVRSRPSFLTRLPD